MNRLYAYKGKLCLSLFALLLAPFISTAQKTWDGGGGSNNWTSANNWHPNGVPTATDAVTIGNGYTVVLNTNATVASLTIGGGTSGTLTIGNSNTDRALTLSGNLLLQTGATLTTAGNGGNVVNVGGNLTNNGTFDMNVGSADCDVTFNGSVNQSLSGTGATTDFNRITISNSGAANNNIVEILPSNFTAAAGFLILTQGIIKMSGSYTFSNTFFNTASPTINADEGIWLNNANVTVTGQAGDTQLSGLLRITAGTYNVGSGADWWFLYNSGAVMIIEGGALNAASGIFGSLTSSTITYTQSGGTVTVNTAGNTGAFGAVPSFGIEATASVFTMSGGTIVIQRLNDAFTDYINLSTSATVTGGTLQVGNASSPAPTFSYWVNSTPPLYNLVVNTTNTPTCDLRVATTFLNDITIGGTLDVSSNNVTITVGNNWFNNGTFIGGTGTVIFNGSGAQQIAGSVGTTFHNFTVNKSANSLTLNRPIRINGAGIFTAGVVNSSSTNLLTFSDNATTSGANNGSTPSYVNGPVRKEGNDDFIFPVGKVGAGYRYCAISSMDNTTDVITAEFMRASASALGSITAPGLKHVSNCEYWDIDEDGPTSPTINITLSWTGLSNCNSAVYVNDLASLTIAHFGTTWDSHGSSSYTGNVSAGDITRNGVSVFSPFALGSTSAFANPLPVKFANLKAYAFGNNNKIEWSNLTEVDIEKYEVERSVDGISFASMSVVAPRSNANTREDYIEPDYNAAFSTIWYRIKAKLIGGTILYSPIVKVSRNERDETKLLVYPNPVVGKQVTIQLYSRRAGSYVVRIFNASAQQVYTANWQHAGGSASRTIELSKNLAPGVYHLQVSGVDTELSSKFIIQ